MDDFKITKVEIDLNTKIVNIEGLEGYIPFKIESFIRQSSFSNNYYIPIATRAKAQLIKFISDKLDILVKQLKIDFNPGTCPECKYEIDLIRIFTLLPFEEEL